MPPSFGNAIFSCEVYQLIGKRLDAAAMSDGKDKASTDTRAPDRPGASATAPSKVPSEARQAPLARSSTDADVADFVRRMKELGPQVAVGRGRLIFAMDATMSRQPTWDMALALQADMFHAVKAVGGLDVQLDLFPRHGRVPGLAMGVGPRRARGADDAGALRRRLHADRQSAEPRARRGGQAAA